MKVGATEARQRRSDDPFPDQLDVDLSTEDIHQKFRNLKRNYHVPDIKYVDMWDNGEMKPFKIENKEVIYHFISHCIF